MRTGLPLRTLWLVALLICFLSQGSLYSTVFAQRPQGRQLAQPEAVQALPGTAKRWALVIGVDKYRDGQISSLKGSANDARMLAEALMRYAGFPSDQVILLATDQPEERQPTRINILMMLSNLKSLVPKDGLLLVSFAGHGIERGGQAYLIPSDARLSNDVSLLEESAVSVVRMKERIKETGVGQVIVLLDACRNDPGGRADAPNPLTAAYTRGFNFDVRNREVQAFATLYATAVGQRAYEYTEKQQGYFTWAVVEGIKGAAANEKGEVTLAMLVKYIQETVPKRIGIDLGADKQQRPFAVIEGYRAEDLVVAVALKTSNAPSSMAATSNALPAPASEEANPADMTETYMWESAKSGDAQTLYIYLHQYPKGHFAGEARKRFIQLSGVKPPTGMSNSPSGQPITSVVGQWKFQFQDSGAWSGVNLLFMEQEGNQIYGAILAMPNPNEFESVAIYGNIVENNIAFNYSYKAHGDTFSWQMSGTCDGKEMKGTYEYRVNDKTRLKGKMFAER